MNINLEERMLDFLDETKSTGPKLAKKDDEMTSSRVNQSKATKGLYGMNMEKYKPKTTDALAISDQIFGKGKVCLHSLDHKKEAGEQLEREDFYRKIASRLQTKTGKLFLSEEAKEADLKNREVNAVYDQLHIMLQQSKLRLKPFLDDGFVHNDRQKQRGETTVSEASDTRTMDKIKTFKFDMERALHGNNVEQVEKLVTSACENMQFTPEESTFYEQV